MYVHLNSIPNCNIRKNCQLNKTKYKREKEDITSSLRLIFILPIVIHS